MEKLPEIMRILFYFVLILLSLEGYTQESFVVFKKAGTPVFKENDSIKSINKGTRLTATCSVSLGKKDSLLYVDKEGSCYSLDEPGTYGFANLSAVRPAQENGSFTQRYFAYVWDEFTRKRKAKSKTGVVYRIDNIVLLQPADSVRIYRPELEFSWSIDAEVSYFLLRDMQNGHITKIGTSGRQLQLFLDNKLLKRGHSYQWAVSDEQFPDLNEIEFNNFQLLDIEEFRNMETDLEVLQNDLRSLGLTSEDIRKSLCTDYKFCY